MPWSESLYPWLGYSAVVSLAVLVLGCGGVLLCRQPARRLRIIELTLAGCLISPLLAIIPGYPHLSVGIWAAVPLQRQAVSTPSPAEPAALGSHLQPPAAPSPVRTLPPSSVAEPPVRGWNVASWIVVLYLSGVAVAVFWWLVGVAALARIVWTAEPAPPRCRALLAAIAGERADRVSLLTSPGRASRSPSPGVGLRSSCPRTSARTSKPCGGRWPTSGPTSKHHHFRAWLVAGLARVLFFYQPLVWWLRRQLRLCQDFVADAQASRQAPQPEDYAEFLTRRAAAGALNPAMVGLGIGFRKSELYRRIIMLVSNRRLEGRDSAAVEHRGHVRRPGLRRHGGCIIEGPRRRRGRSIRRR